MAESEARLPRFGFQRAIAEFAVIVIGVLTALAVDAWASGRREKKLEQEYLQRLEQDIRLTVESLKDSEVFFRLVSQSAQRALDLVDGRASDADISESLAALYNASRGENTVYHEATFQELVGTASLRLIRDVELRSALSDYHLAIIAYRDEFSAWDDRNPYRDRIRRLIPAEYQARLVASCPLNAQEKCSVISNDERARAVLELIASDQELRRHLNIWVASQPNIARNTRNMIEGAEKVLQQVQAAIDDPKQERP